MKEWLEVIRDPEYFNLLVMDSATLNTDESFVIETQTGPITIQYEEVRIINDAPISNAPNFIAVTEVHSYVSKDSTLDNLIPHAEEPAPAQRAGNIAFIWGERVGGTIAPYREDGFPAVIIAVGISKYYQRGNLSRKGQHPAIKMEHLAALWYNKRDEHYRGNGPKSISFDNYKEFWTAGEFKGHRWSDYHLGWNIRARDESVADEFPRFLKDIKGTTNMFSDVYFNDAADEVCYITNYS